MADNLTIRCCEKKDELTYVDLNLAFMEESLAEDPYWTRIKIPTRQAMGETFREALGMPELMTLFIAEIGGEACGFANIQRCYSIWSRGLTMTIDDLYITPAFRGQGIGEGMMDFIVAFAEDQGYHRIQLHSGLTNYKAHALYKKLGFEAEETSFFMKSLGTNK